MTRTQSKKGSKRWENIAEAKELARLEQIPDAIAICLELLKDAKLPVYDRARTCLIVAKIAKPSLFPQDYALEALACLFEAHFRSLGIAKLKQEVWDEALYALIKIWRNATEMKEQHDIFNWDAYQKRQMTADIWGHWGYMGRSHFRRLETKIISMAGESWLDYQPEPCYLYKDKNKTTSPENSDVSAAISISSTQTTCLLKHHGQDERNPPANGQPIVHTRVTEEGVEITILEKSKSIKIVVAEVESLMAEE